MLGFRTRHAVPNLLILLGCTLGMACSDDPEPPGADGGGRFDLGPTDGGEDAGRPDGGATDAGLDAGEDAGVDGGALRRLIQRTSFPPRTVHNFVLAPDFELRMFNLGWVPGRYDGNPIAFTRYIDTRAPTPRAEWIMMPSAAEGGSYVAGFGRAPTERMRVEAYIVETETSTAPGQGFELGVHGVGASGDQLALVLEPAGAPLDFEGLRFTRYEGETSAPWLGFVTFFFVSGASSPVGFGSPFIEPAPEADGAARRPGLIRVPRPRERSTLGQVWKEATRIPSAVPEVAGLPESLGALR